MEAARLREREGGERMEMVNEIYRGERMNLSSLLLIFLRCLEVLNFQTLEPPKIFPEVGFQQHFPEPPGTSLKPPESALLQNQ
jgi:hypothetical protein